MEDSRGLEGDFGEWTSRDGLERLLRSDPSSRNVEAKADSWREGPALRSETPRGEVRSSLEAEPAEEVCPVCCRLRPVEGTVCLGLEYRLVMSISACW